MYFHGEPRGHREPKINLIGALATEKQILYNLVTRVTDSLRIKLGLIV